MPESLPLSTQVSILERPGQAFQNTLVGDLPGAMQAMFTPDTLSPRQRDAFLKEHGLDKGPWANLFRLVANPALILTLALSFKFPVANAKNMFQVKNSVEAMTKRFPILGRLSSMQGIFRGTGVSEDYGQVVRDIWDFRARYNGRMSTVLRQFRASSGRLPTQSEQLMVSSWLDGLHRPLRGWEGKAGVLTFGKGGSRVEVPSVGTLMPNLEAHMTPQVRRLAQNMRGVLDEQWGESFGSVANRKAIQSTMARLKNSGQADELTEQWAEFLKNPQKVPDFFPHRMITTEADFQQMMKAMTDASSGRAFGRAAGRKAERWLGPENYKRQHAMMPSLAEMDILASKGMVDKVALNRLKDATKFKVLARAQSEGNLTQTTMRKLEAATFDQIKERFPAIMSQKEGLAFGGVLAEATPRQYSLRLMPILNH